MTTPVSSISPGLAAAYSSSATYSKGQHVLYLNKYWKCNTKIENPEPWTPSHWTEDTTALDTAKIADFSDIDGLDVSKGTLKQAMNKINEILNILKGGASQVSILLFIMLAGCLHADVPPVTVQKAELGDIPADQEVVTNITGTIASTGYVDNAKSEAEKTAFLSITNEDSTAWTWSTPTSIVGRIKALENAPPSGVTESRVLELVDTSFSDGTSTVNRVTGKESIWDAKQNALPYSCVTNLDESVLTNYSINVDFATDAATAGSSYTSEDISRGEYTITPDGLQIVTTNYDPYVTITNVIAFTKDIPEVPDNIVTFEDGDPETSQEILSAAKGESESIASNLFETVKSNYVIKASVNGSELSIQQVTDGVSNTVSYYGGEFDPVVLNRTDITNYLDAVAKTNDSVVGNIYRKRDYADMSAYVERYFPWINNTTNVLYAKRHDEGDFYWYGTIDNYKDATLTFTDGEWKLKLGFNYYVSSGSSWTSTVVTVTNDGVSYTLSRLGVSEIRDDGYIPRDDQVALIDYEGKLTNVVGITGGHLGLSGIIGKNTDIEMYSPSDVGNTLLHMDYSGITRMSVSNSAVAFQSGVLFPEKRGYGWHFSVAEDNLTHGAPMWDKGTVYSNKNTFVVDESKLWVNLKSDSTNKGKKPSTNTNYWYDMSTIQSLFSASNSILLGTITDATNGFETADHAERTYQTKIKDYTSTNAVRSIVNAEVGGTNDIVHTSQLESYVKTSRKINNHPLTSDVTLTSSDVGAIDGLSVTNILKTATNGFETAAHAANTYLCKYGDTINGDLTINGLAIISNGSEILGYGQYLNLSGINIKFNSFPNSSVLVPDGSDVLTANSATNTFISQSTVGGTTVTNASQIISMIPEKDYSLRSTSSASVTCISGEIVSLVNVSGNISVTLPSNSASKSADFILRIVASEPAQITSVTPAGTTLEWLCDPLTDIGSISAGTYYVFFSRAASNTYCVNAQKVK